MQRAGYMCSRHSVYARWAVHDAGCRQVNVRVLGCSSAGLRCDCGSCVSEFVILRHCSNWISEVWDRGYGASLQGDAVGGGRVRRPRTRHEQTQLRSEDRAARTLHMIQTSAAGGYLTYHVHCSQAPPVCPLCSPSRLLLCLPAPALMSRSEDSEHYFSTRASAFWRRPMRCQYGDHCDAL